MERFIRSNKAASWSREEVMDYLQTYLMTDNLIHTMEDEIRMLENTKNQIVRIGKPYLYHEKQDNEHAALFSACAFLPGVIAAFVQEIHGTFEGFLFRTFMYYFAGYAVGWCIDHAKKTSNERHMNRDYEKKLMKYQQNSVAVASAEAALDQKINDMHYQLSQLTGLMAALKNENIVYPGFQKPELVYIIWEHMDRNPSLTYLEAENATVDDRRVLQITNGLDAIRRSVDNLRPYLSDLRLAAYEVRSALGHMETSLREDIQLFNNSFHQEVADLKRQQAMYAQAQQGLLAGINRNVEALQYNQYMDLVRQDMRRYGISSIWL